MSAENTNAGGGEATAKIGGGYGGPVKILTRFQMSDGQERFVVGFKPEGGYGECAHIFSRAQLSGVDAALSAHSTGRAGVAAEPVAWADLIATLKNKIKEAELHEYGRLQLSDFIVEQKDRLVGALEGTGTTSAYAFDVNGPLGWQAAASPHKPSEACHRNIRPLYEHLPVAAASVAGWKLVPVEPTPEMLVASNLALGQHIASFTKEQRGSRWGKPNDSFGYRVKSREKATVRYRAMLAAAPTPPAGGGETMQAAREALGRMKAREGEDVDRWADRLGADLAAAGEAEFAPASPAGDLVSLSAAIVGAMESYLRVCSSGGMPRDKRDTVEKAVKQAAKLGYFDALAAPVAPQKGPSAGPAYVPDDLTGAERLRWIVGYYGLDMPFGVGTRLMEVADQFDAALITPADRGETQAVGDGWSDDMDAAPKDGTHIEIYRPSQWKEEERHIVRWDDDTTIGEWWVVHDGKNDNLLRGPNPTHWRIPSPSPDQNRGEPDQGGANTEAGR